MKLLTLLVLCGWMIACQSDRPAPQTPEPAWDAPSTVAAVLVGTVRDPLGNPISGVAVRTYGGFATRFLIDATQTDALGQYRFVLDSGVMASPSGDGLPRAMVGVCVGSVRNANPAEFLPWEDVWFDNGPGVVARMDFVFDAESVPEAYRD